MQKQTITSITLFLHILSIFLPSLSLFSHFCLVYAIYLPIFRPFLPVLKSSFSNFCPILRLAEKFDTKGWYISLAEQNWRIWPPLRGNFFGRTGLGFGRKKCPRNAYGTRKGGYELIYSFSCFVLVSTRLQSG